MQTKNKKHTINLHTRLKVYAPQANIYPNINRSIPHQNTLPIALPLPTLNMDRIITLTTEDSCNNTCVVAIPIEICNTQNQA